MKTATELLYTAVQENDVAGVKKALEAGADATSENSWTLRHASDSGQAECVRLLIPVSDPRARNSEALENAAFKGHIECVRMLLPVSDPEHVVSSLEYKELFVSANRLKSIIQEEALIAKHVSPSTKKPAGSL